MVDSIFGKRLVLICAKVSRKNTWMDYGAVFEQGSQV